jgi:hypothetical protein
MFERAKWAAGFGVALSRHMCVFAVEDVEEAKKLVAPIR